MATTQPGPWGPTDTFPGGGGTGAKMGGEPAWCSDWPRRGGSAVPCRGRRKEALGREGAPPRWRGGRLLGAARAEVRHGAREASGHRRPDQRTEERTRDQGFYLGVLLRFWNGRVFPALLRFRRLDFPAEFAGMLTIESLLDGDRHAASALRVVMQHPGPGDGLQHGPVAARNREESERRENEAELTEHGGQITARPTARARSLCAGCRPGRNVFRHPLTPGCTWQRYRRRSRRARF